MPKDKSIVLFDLEKYDLAACNNLLQQHGSQLKRSVSGEVTPSEVLSYAARGSLG